MLIWTQRVIISMIQMQMELETELYSFSPAPSTAPNTILWSSIQHSQSKQWNTLYFNFLFRLDSLGKY